LTDSSPFPRRTFLAACAALAAGPRLSARVAALPLSGLAAVHGPASGISVLLGGLARSLGVPCELWRNVDELRAGLASGRIQATLLPSYVAAALAARGVDLRLAAVVTRGYLQLLAPEPLAGIQALAGRRVGFFLRHDLPDLMFQVLARQAGMDPARDIRAIYTSGGLETVQLLEAGRLDAALVVEPLATAVLARNPPVRHLVRALDLAQAWQLATGRKGGYPQVAFALSGAHLDQAPRIQAGLREAVRLSEREPARLLQGAPEGLGVPPGILRSALPWMNLEMRTGLAAREDLEAFFRSLLAVHPSLLGGGLPAAPFYLP